MKVLLKEDIDNIGYAGEVHTVADGYGRNYLLPKGMAVIATPGTLKQAETWRKKAEARRAELRAEHEALSAQIQEVRLVFSARAGESGKLYGSVTTSQITDEMNEILGTEIDRRKVGQDPLRQLGEHKVVVRLSADFHPELTVVIEPEGEVVPMEEFKADLEEETVAPEEAVAVEAEAPVAELEAEPEEEPVADLAEEIED